MSELARLRAEARRLDAEENVRARLERRRASQEERTARKAKGPCPCKGNCCEFPTTHLEEHICDSDLCQCQEPEALVCTSCGGSCRHPRLQAQQLQPVAAAESSAPFTMDRPGTRPVRTTRPPARR